MRSRENIPFTAFLIAIFLMAICVASAYGQKANNQTANAGAAQHTVATSVSQTTSGATSHRTGAQVQQTVAAPVSQLPTLPATARRFDDVRAANAAMQQMKAGQVGRGLQQHGSPALGADYGGLLKPVGKQMGIDLPGLPSGYGQIPGLGKNSRNGLPGLPSAIPQKPGIGNNNQNQRFPGFPQTGRRVSGSGNKRDNSILGNGFGRPTLSISANRFANSEGGVLNGKKISCEVVACGALGGGAVALGLLTRNAGLIVAGAMVAGGTCGAAGDVCGYLFPDNPKPADKPKPADNPKPADKPKPADNPKPADKNKDDIKVKGKMCADDNPGCSNPYASRTNQLSQRATTNPLLNPMQTVQQSGRLSQQQNKGMCADDSPGCNNPHASRANQFSQRATANPSLNKAQMVQQPGRLNQQQQVQSPQPQTPRLQASPANRTGARP